MQPAPEHRIPSTLANQSRRKKKRKIGWCHQLPGRATGDHHRFFLLTVISVSFRREQRGEKGKKGKEGGKERRVMCIAEDCALNLPEQSSREREEGKRKTSQSSH